MDATRLKAIAAVKDAAKVKDKPWKSLSASEKVALLKAVCKMLGLYGGTD